MLFYQDFNEQFEGYTQLWCCNSIACIVVLSGFQWTIWRIYTTAVNLRFASNLLFYQDFNEQFEGYTQLSIHHDEYIKVVLSGFQWTIWRIYTTSLYLSSLHLLLFYQDFNEQFEGYTQLLLIPLLYISCCFIRISMNNLKDIHNHLMLRSFLGWVVLSGFQWTIWRIYTTLEIKTKASARLFYQDFNEQFEGYTQLLCFFSLQKNVVLSGFQWTIWRIYTTVTDKRGERSRLFYQDFNEQFEGYTQQ